MNVCLYKDQYQNAVRISEYAQFEGETAFSNLAIKYVVSGAETYVLKGKRMKIRKGEYILGNNNAPAEVFIGENTTGLCLDISNEIVAEIAQNNDGYPDFVDYLLSERLLINRYAAHHNRLGEALQILSSLLLIEGSDEELSPYLFYTLGECLVADQSLIFKQYSKLRYKRKQVHEENFRNLLQAKQFMDDCFTTQINLDELSALALTSKFAFIRQFKIAFGQTPYHYIRQRRLNLARELLLKGEQVSHIAFQTGFSDLPSFSKAFKKHFGVSPGLLMK